MTRRSGGFVVEPVAAAAGRSDPAQLRDLLARLALAGERYQATVARQLGLSDTEMGAVVCLCRYPQLTPGELRERLALSSGGTTAVIQRLERAGHVERRPNPSDGRSAVIRVSSEMRTLLTTSVAPLIGAFDTVAASFAPEERETIVAWLDRIVALAEAQTADEGDHRDRFAAAAAPGGVPNAWF